MKFETKLKIKKIILVFSVITLVVIGLLLTLKNAKIKKPRENIQIKIGTTLTPTLTTPTIVPSVTASPSAAKKMTFEEMNNAYGPCARVNILMYHHVSNLNEIQDKGEKNLTVDTQIFRKQMEYLKEKNYSVIGMDSLKNFLENGNGLPSKCAVITADDAYEDNFSKMFPILKEYGFKATIFTPTGLVNNPDYLSWNQIEEMKNSGLISFANHTWSHHNSGGTLELQNKEIGLANTQLQEKGLNSEKIFAYPYGKPSKNAEKVLGDLGYKLAFTTNYGNIVCKRLSLEIPRIRIGNAQLNSYGL